MDLVGKPDHKGGQRNLIAQVRQKLSFLDWEETDGETPGRKHPAVLPGAVGAPTCPLLLSLLRESQGNGALHDLSSRPKECDSHDHKMRQLDAWPDCHKQTKT